jgi:hypothetical protein
MFSRLRLSSFRSLGLAQPERDALADLELVAHELHHVADMRKNVRLLIVPPDEVPKSRFSHWPLWCASLWNRSDETFFMRPYSRWFQK